MTRVLFSIVIVLAFAAVCKPQEVSLVTPVSGAELLDSPSPNFVLIQLHLKGPDSDQEARAAIDDVQFTECSAATGNRRAVVGPADVPTQAMLKTCTFQTGTATSNLPADWGKLTLELKFRVRGSTGTFGPVQTFTRLSPITRCIRVSDVSATLGSAIRTGDREITIPIKLNADTRLRVELRRADGSVVATPSGNLDNSSVLFEDSDQSKPVILKVVPGSQFIDLTETYTISLSQLPSQPPIELQLKGAPASFRVNAFRPYVMTEPSIDVNDDGSVRVRFATATSGSVQVFLNGATDAVFSDNDKVQRDFVIPSEKVVPDANTLTFQGESAENHLKLSNNAARTAIRNPKTFLTEKPVTFNYDEATNKLKIKFALSRNLNTRWQFKNANGLGANVGAVQGETNVFEAVVDLNLQDNATLIDSRLVDVNTVLKRAPIEIEVVNASKPSEVVASFLINFVKPAANVKTKLQAADTFASQNKKDQAKAAIAEALGFIGSLTNDQKQTIDTIFSQFKQPGETTKSKVFKALAIAGKFAAGMFGIPLL
jgi:hypothetical protein